MDFEQVEDAIIEELKTALPEIRTVETYAGQLEGELKSLPINYPAVFVAYTGSQYDRLNNVEYNEVAEFSVMVAAKNLRSKEAARKEALGCYELAKSVLATLNGKKLGLDISPLLPLRMQLILISQTVSVYGIDFQTDFDGNYTISN